MWDLMRPEIWIGIIEISYLDDDAPKARKSAFTVVTTCASNPEEFGQKCNEMLESYGWKLLGIDKANPAPNNYIFSEEVEDMLERTRLNPNAIIYGTCHTYPVM
jgi:hypothetical protein